MDRDIAISLVEKLGVLNTALTKLSANTAPSNPNRGENRTLMIENVPEEREVVREESEVIQEEPEVLEEPEPVPETTRKRTTSK